MPSIGDPAMRHGRKTKVRTFTGFKRHVVKLVDADVIVDAVVRPANEPEHTTLAQVLPAVTAHGPLRELFIDRGYLASPMIADLHAAGVAIRAKAWTSRNGDRFPKHAFTIDLAAGHIVCPCGPHGHHPTRRHHGPLPRDGVSAMPATGGLHDVTLRRPLDCACIRRKRCCKPSALRNRIPRVPERSVRLDADIQLVRLKPDTTTRRCRAQAPA